MKQQILPTNRGLDTILYLDGKAVAGQQSAKLNRGMTPIDITNKINGEWTASIAGLRHWSIFCSGMFIKDDESFQKLEDAFNTGKKLTVRMANDDITYYGEGYITSFPVNASYSKEVTYQLNIKGTGPLE